MPRGSKRGIKFEIKTRSRTRSNSKKKKSQHRTSNGFTETCAFSEPKTSVLLNPPSNLELPGFPLNDVQSNLFDNNQSAIPSLDNIPTTQATFSGVQSQTIETDFSTNDAPIHNWTIPQTTENDSHAIIVQGPGDNGPVAHAFPLPLLQALHFAAITTDNFGKKKRVAIHDLFDEHKNNTDDPTKKGYIKECIICGRSIRVVKSNTSSMRSHIGSTHLWDKVEKLELTEHQKNVLQKVQIDIRAEKFKRERERASKKLQKEKNGIKRNRTRPAKKRSSRRSSSINESMSEEEHNSDFHKSNSAMLAPSSEAPNEYADDEKATLLVSPNDDERNDAIPWNSTATKILKSFEDSQENEHSQKNDNHSQNYDAQTQASASLTDLQMPLHASQSNTNPLLASFSNPLLQASLPPIIEMPSTSFTQTSPTNLIPLQKTSQSAHDSSSSDPRVSFPYFPDPVRPNSCGSYKNITSDYTPTDQEPSGKSNAIPNSILSNPTNASTENQANVNLINASEANMNSGNREQSLHSGYMSTTREDHSIEDKHSRSSPTSISGSQTLTTAIGSSYSHPISINVSTHIEETQAQSQAQSQAQLQESLISSTSFAPSILPQPQETQAPHAVSPTPTSQFTGQSSLTKQSRKRQRSSRYTGSTKDTHTKLAKSRKSSKPELSIISIVDGYIGLLQIVSECTPMSECGFLGLQRMRDALFPQFPLPGADVLNEWSIIAANLWKKSLRDKIKGKPCTIALDLCRNPMLRNNDTKCLAITAYFVNEDFSISGGLLDVLQVDTNNKQLLASDLHQCAAEWNTSIVAASMDGPDDLTPMLSIGGIPRVPCAARSLETVIAIAMRMHNFIWKMCRKVAELPTILNTNPELQQHFLEFQKECAPDKVVEHLRPAMMTQWETLFPLMDKLAEEKIANALDKLFYSFPNSSPLMGVRLTEVEKLVLQATVKLLRPIRLVINAVTKEDLNQYQFVVPRVRRLMSILRMLMQSRSSAFVPSLSGLPASSLIPALPLAYQSSLRDMISRISPPHNASIEAHTAAQHCQKLVCYIYTGLRETWLLDPSYEEVDEDVMIASQEITPAIRQADIGSVPLELMVAAYFDPHNANLTHLLPAEKREVEHFVLHEAQALAEGPGWGQQSPSRGNKGRTQHANQSRDLDHPGTDPMMLELLKSMGSDFTQAIDYQSPISLGPPSHYDATLEMLIYQEEAGKWRAQSRGSSGTLSNALSWWNKPDIQKKLPLLTMLAKKYVSVPASCTPMNLRFGSANPAKQPSASTIASGFRFESSHIHELLQQSEDFFQSVMQYFSKNVQECINDESSSSSSPGVDEYEDSDVSFD